MNSPSSFNTANNRSRSSSEAEADIHVAQYQTYDRYTSDVVPTTESMSGVTETMSSHHYDSATATPTIHTLDVASPTSPSSMYSDYGRMTPAAESFHDSDGGDYRGGVTGDNSGVGLGFAGIPRSGLPFNYESEVRQYGDDSDRDIGGVTHDIGGVTGDTHDMDSVAHDMDSVTNDTHNTNHVTHDTNNTHSTSSPIPGAFPDIDSEEYTVGANAHRGDHTTNVTHDTRDTHDIERVTHDTGNVSLDAAHDMDRVTHDTTGVTHDTGNVTNNATNTPSRPTSPPQSFGHYSPATHDSDVDHLEPPGGVADSPGGVSDVTEEGGEGGAESGYGAGSGGAESYGAGSGYGAQAGAESGTDSSGALADARAPAGVSRFSFSDRSPSKPDVTGHYRSHSQTGTSPNKSASRKLHKSKVSQTSIESFSLPKGEEARDEMDKKLGE